MQKIIRPIIALLILTALATAASKPHVVAFGKTFTVKLFLGPTESQSQEIKVRALTVDGKIKEFTTGEPHDITDTIFTIQRAYRVNDSLPNDEKTLPKWKWQKGGWVLVDRASGRVSQLRLPEFDAYYSAASWYRDYVAYCGVSDNGEKLFAIVAQVGVKKPVLKNPLGPATGGELPDSECAPPTWQRQPMRVSFYPKNSKQVTYEVHGRAADVSTEPEAAKNEESN
ncbi:MAG TPA: hypothetical protein VD837_00935 [Terriglobales bacterium]|nr:hypothetical protein [Terriglobales bacterium]